VTAPVRAKRFFTPMHRRQRLHRQGAADDGLALKSPSHSVQAAPGENDCLRGMALVRR
jgi:hypothetical protein